MKPRSLDRHWSVFGQRWQIDVGGLALFFHQLPQHQGCVGAADGDDVAVVEEEPGTGHRSAVYLLFVVFGLGTQTGIPKQS